MLLAALGLLLATLPVNDQILADLNSPNYAVRDKARDALRASFVPTDRTKWDSLHAMLVQSKGKNSTDIAIVLHDKLGAYTDTVRFGRFSISWTQLDDDWALECIFEEDSLVDVRLLLQPQVVNSQPPPGYTGIWRVYRMDGSLASDSYYMHGIRGGPLGDGGFGVGALPQSEWRRVPPQQ
jgi:hypothetical protein